MVSVVVTSLNSAGTLKDCLVALERQTAKDGVEIIVVDSSNDGSRELVHREFPRVKLLAIPYPGSRALMRARGVNAAKGDIVALTEDHCVPREDWLARVVENHRSPCVAAGGAVENSAENRAAYWAIYFCEYYRFMPPVRGGPVADIPGSNASYKREALAKTDFGGIGLWDNLINVQLGSNGGAGNVVSDPSQIVYHNKQEAPLSFLVHRYHFSRCFAGFRVRRARLWKRLLYTALSPSLPVIVLWRTLGDVWRKGRNRGKLARSLPFLLPFVIGSAAGEFMGYAFGAGESWRKIN
ncbi:MAG: glycosyltransferase [Chloroflexi bacterium]|nr:glycosyltransferase [Chloroflexota bacterium]